MVDSQNKGANYERRIANMLPGARKISRMYAPGPDLIWNDRYVECKKRSPDTGYLSMNKMIAYLEDDTDIIVTALDYRTDYVIMELTELLDLLDEAAE